ncbi:pilus assembly protein N-terminal domain-containing protein [Noviherbaspirillum pedocola]|uniref:Type IV pilus biogenesis and competence protein PilQ n=1 Tax=Noviherbaspirillum pedocola TaxID=2801341 RepID=A0A934W6N9_9BURK|nr:pilus assembly protein N-terminal domain-containing protein [Noviherbaspirillum pedocola]MBK4733734.1 pilus assembly protein N-terminal domain-containing protein [Noviherbaspirillum pedocola]
MPILRRSLMPCLAALACAGQALADATPVATAAASSPRNVFADSLKRARHPAAAQAPYAPIRVDDDSAQLPEIEMFVGESRVFPTPGVSRIAVGNGRIMTAAALDGRETLIFANEVGTSSLFVWNEDGRYQRIKINIVPGDTSRHAREIAAFLSAMPRARASVIGDKVIVEGDGLSDVELDKIDELGKRYPQIVNFTNRLGWERMVLLDVKIAEFPLSALSEVGVRWTPAGGGALGAIWAPLRYGSDGPYQINVQNSGGGNAAPITSPQSGGGGQGGVPLPSGLNILSGVNLGLNAQLNLLAQNGRAAILAEPQLSARNGAKASFLAGGEYPYTVSTINGPTVLFKPYGVKLEIQPRVDSAGVIRAKIDSEVSSIDAAISTPAGPGLRTRKTSTEFNVKSGETIVLGGLLSRETSTDIDKVPLLGDLPVLGPLFRSKRFQNKETELVVFVTPTVVDSQTPELAERITSTKRRLEQTMGPPPYLSDALQPGQDPGSFRPARSEAEGPHADAATSATSDAGGSLLVTRRAHTLLRAEPARDAAILLSLSRGARLRLGESDAPDGRWRHVVAGEIAGWVEAEAVAPASEADAATWARGRDATAEQRGAALAPITAQAAPTQAMPPREMRVTLDRLALRVAPDINAAVLRKLQAGTIVRLLPQAQRGYWSAVEIDGRRGWVATQWLAPQEGMPRAAR